jgi:NADH:ubiquinone oxidoreductase subunit 3 (subunit A)
MTRRIFVELALFLLPFVLFFIYRAASRELRVKDRWPLTVLAIVGVALAIIALIAEPLLAPSQKGKCFLAARYEKGVTIPPQEVDCNAASAPDKSAPPPTPPPVAPRNQPSAASSPPGPVQTLPTGKTPPKPPEGVPEIPAKPPADPQAPPPTVVVPQPAPSQR